MLWHWICWMRYYYTKVLLVCHLYSKKLDFTNSLLNCKRDTNLSQKQFSWNFMRHLVHWRWLAKRAFGLANKNSWIIWFRKWILFDVSEKSRWNDWRLFWQSQSCKIQSLIFSLILCSLRTKHWIGTQELETVKKIYPNYFAKGNVDVLEIKKAPQKCNFYNYEK